MRRPRDVKPRLRLDGFGQSTLRRGFPVNPALGTPRPYMRMPSSTYLAGHYSIVDDWLP